MSLSDLAALGSFVSGLAVVFSFVFLGFQMRQANLNQRSLMQQGRTGRTIDILLRFTDQKLGSTIVRAFKGDASLSESEVFAFYGFAAAIFWSYEDSFLQFQNGTLDQKSWASDVSTLKGLLNNPAYRGVWRAARNSIGGAYQQFVDGLMLEVKGAPVRNISTLLNQYIKEEMELAGQSVA